jgi:twitching motility protein PilT
MRDLETMQAAITIAETGHLVFATLHTNSAATSVDRIIDVFPAHQQPQIRTQLASNLQAICSQRLIPKISGGRTIATEILVGNSAMRNIIREGKTNQLDAVIQTGIDQGMISMDKSLVTLVQKGQVALEEARSIASNPLTFDQLMGNRQAGGGAGAQF